MDDVAREVSMSKKTLYQYFDNKDDLITESVDHHIKIEIEVFEQMSKVAKNAVHEIILMSQCIREMVGRTNPALLFDLQKYHSRAWDIYLDFKQNKIKGSMKRILLAGKIEGFFRAELDAEVLSILRVEQTQLAFNNKVYPFDQFNFRDVQLQIFDHFVHGILTDKGRKVYQEYTEQENSN